jgi:hypothetical protein
MSSLSPVSGSIYPPAEKRPSVREGMKGGLQSKDFY